MSMDEDSNDQVKEEPTTPAPPEEEGIKAPVVSFADHKEKGNQCYTRKHYREAIENYTLAIETAPNDPAVTKGMVAAVYSNRAAAHQMLFQYDAALDDCNAAMEADPTFLKVHWRKAKVMTTLGRLDEALKAYSMGLIHDPNDAKIQTEKADVRKLQQRYELAKELLAAHDGSTSGAKAKKDARQAVAQLEIVVANCPNWDDAQVLLLQAKVAMGGGKNIDAAYALSTQLLRRRSSTSAETTSQVALLYARAQCLFYQGSMDDAMKHLKQILGDDPDNKKAFALVKTIRHLKKLKDTADTAYKGRQYETAIQLYTETLEACPEDNESLRAKLFFNRGACHNALRQHPECIKDCTSALAIQPDYTKALLRRAASNLLIGGKAECEGAIRDYEKAMEMTSSEEEQRDINEKLRSAKIQLKRAGRKDLYKILGVSRDATENEIKKSYRKLALKLHPDRQTNVSEKEKEAAEAKFREVNLAHEILSDAQKRKRYDQGVDEQDIDDPNARPGGHGHQHGGGVSQEMLFQMFMQQQGQRRSGGHPGFHFG